MGNFLDFFDVPKRRNCDSFQSARTKNSQYGFLEGTSSYVTAKKACGYLSPVPRYGPPNFANFGVLAPKNFWRNGTLYFLPVRKAQGPAVCVQNFSVGLDTLPEIWGIMFDVPPKKRGRFLHEITTLTARSVLNYGLTGMEFSGKVCGQTINGSKM